MPAYAYDTASQLTVELHGNNIDSTTAAQITAFLQANGTFKDNSPAAGTTEPTVLVEGPTSLTGSDSTPNIDVYEVTDNNFNSNLATLPSATAIVLTGAGPDTLNIFDNVTGSYLFAAGDGGNFINLHAATGNNTVLSGSGNDTIDLGAGNETVFSGTGNDSIAVAAGVNQIHGTDSTGSGGTDTFDIYGGTNTVYTGNGNNLINAFTGQNTIFLGSGADTVDGYNPSVSTSSDTDSIVLGSGPDLVKVGLGHWTVTGGSGTDTIDAVGGGASTIDLSGTTGSNLINLYTGSNSITGGNFGDIINAYASNNTINAGNGSDSINLYSPTYSGASNTDVVNLNGGNDTVHTGQGTGTINGGSGNELVEIGNGGTWTYNGSTAGTPNADSLSGASDTIQVDSSAYASGTNTITGGSHYDYFNIFGGTNSVTGGTGGSQFNVNTTNDQTLVGGSGTNRFNIGQYSDPVTQDTVAATGTDTIIGGSGYNEYDINLTSGSVNISINGATDAAHNTVDFTKFGAAQGVDHNAATNTDTYTFGSGLSVTIHNASDATIKFGV